MEQADKKFEFLMELFNDPDWELVKNIKGVVTEKKMLPGYDIACFRASGFVDCDPVSLMDFVCNIYNSENNMKKYDPDLLEYGIVEKLTDDSRICYQVNSLTWPLWPRDLVYIQTIREIDGAYWLLMYSVESDLRPENPAKYVRAILNISAYGFVPENDGCRVYRIAHIDPSGYIPTSIINSYADKIGKIVKQLQTLYPSA